MSILSLMCSLTLGQIGVGLLTFVALQILNSWMVRYQLFKTFKRQGIPGPTPDLFAGNEFETDQTKSKHLIVEQWSRKYGKTFGTFFGYIPVLNTRDLDLLQAVFIDNPTVFQSRKYFISNRPLTDSILFNSGERWKTIRKLLTPAFGRYRVMGEESTKFIDDSIGKMIKYIDARFEAEGNSIEVDILPLMKSTALHLVSSMTLHLKHIEISEKSDYVLKMDNYLSSMEMDSMFSPVRWAIRFPFIADLLGLLLKFISFGFVKEILGNVENEIELIQKDKGDKKRETSVLTQMTRFLNGGKMTKEEVLGNALALLIAGYETTSTTLSYIFYALGSNTDVQTKLRQELSRDGMDSKYLTMVINETMRLYNTIMTFTQRVATRDITINGIKIEKGVMVMFNSTLIHHDPDNWTEPMEFDPERFDEGKKHHPCAFAPFGLGQRMCIGYQLAMLEMRYILTEVLTRYNIELISPKELLPLQTSAVVLSKPAEEIRLRLTRLSSL